MVDMNLKGVKLESSSFMAPAKLPETFKKEVGTIDFNLPAAKVAKGTLKKDDLKSLLTKYGQDTSRKATKDIESFEFDDKNGSLTINYLSKSNKGKRIVNNDLSYQTITTRSNPASGEDEKFHNFYDSDNNLLREKRISTKGSFETYYDKNKGIQKTVEYNKANSSTTTVEFDGLNSPKSKIVSCGTTVTKFDYNGENNSERILEKTENKGLPIERKETYTYRGDGSIEIRCCSASITPEAAKESDPNIPNSVTNRPMSSDAGTTTEKNENNNNKATQESNKSYETVVYCSSSNFDSKTGTVKNPEQVTTTPPDSSDSKEAKNVHDEESHNGQPVKQETPPSSVVNKGNDDVPKSEPITAKAKPNTTEAVTDSSKSNVSKSDTVKPKESDAVNITGQKGNKQISAPIPESGDNISKNRTSLPEPNIKKMEQSPDVGALASQIKNVKEKISNLIKEYSAKTNLSESKVKELIGFNKHKSEQEIFNSIEQIKDWNAGTKISKLLTNLDSLLSQSSHNMQAIQAKISELSKIAEQIKNSKKSDDSDFAVKGEPKIISDITKFSTDNGLKASELSDAISKLNAGEFLIGDFTKTTPTDSVTATYKVEKSKDGSVTITKVINTTANIKAQKIEQFKSNLMPLIPSGFRNQLAKCETLADCKKIIKEFIRKSKYNLTESVNSNIKSSDLQYKYVYKDGIYQKVPANRASASEFVPVEELRLNVKADKEFFNELSKMMKNGVYDKKSGKNIRPNIVLKTAASDKEWAEQVEPVVLSFDKPIPPEVEAEISKIAHKFARTKRYDSINDKKSDVATIQNSKSDIEKRNERIFEILSGLGIPNVQTTAFIASLAASSGCIRKTVNKNSNETAPSDAVSMNDSVD